MPCQTVLPEEGDLWRVSSLKWPSDASESVRTPRAIPLKDASAKSKSFATDPVALYNTYGNEYYQLMLSQMEGHRELMGNRTLPTPCLSRDTALHKHADKNPQSPDKLGKEDYTAAAEMNENPRRIRGSSVKLGSIQNGLPSITPKLQPNSRRKAGTLTRRNTVSITSSSPLNS